MVTARMANTKEKKKILQKNSLLSSKITTCVGETRETKETQKDKNKKKIDG